MNKPSNHRPQVRRVAREANPEFAQDYEEDDYQEDEVEAEEAYAPPPATQRRRDRQHGKPAPRRAEGHEGYSSDRGYGDRGYSGGGRKGRDRGYGGDVRPRRNVPARRDPFPILIGAIIGAAVIGLVAMVFLLTAKSNGPTTAGTNTTNPSSSSSSTTPNPANSGNAGSTDKSSSGEPPPRMPLEDFRKLYDDPAKRPLIIDVRAKDVYDQGHIKGAISFPEADLDTRVGELPKDKLVIAYCQ